jgi:hypothetical protein
VAKREVKSPAKGIDWPSHPVVRNWDKKVVKRTENGPAVFMPGLPLTPIQMAELYLEDDIDTIPGGADPDGAGVNRYWRDMGYNVGASEGKVTQFILIKRDATEAHARPVTRSELQRVWKVSGL